MKNNYAIPQFFHFFDAAMKDLITKTLLFMFPRSFIVSVLVVHLVVK
jgi:hypothetical protein